MADALIVRKEGEGFGRPQGDNALPLDINYSKIADWLVDRKQLPSDWRKRLQVIAGKMAEASLSLPAELQADLKGPEGAAVLDYYRVRHIRDKLAESAEKTIFGYYTGPAGTWDKLVTAYEKGHVYLGEAGQTLLRNVDYEIPYADKQAAKLQQQLADLERKQADHLKSASASAAEYKQECKQLGISGSNIGRELIQLLDELPATFASTLTALHSDRIGDAMQHYQEFTAYAHPSSQHSADRQRMPDSAAEPLLPTLAEVRAAGSSTAPPHCGSASATAPAASAQSSGTHAGPASCIDWDVSQGGSATSAAPAADGINWGLDTDGAGGQPGAAPAKISWDLDVSDAAAATTADAAGSTEPVEISWDFDTADVGIADVAADAAGEPSNAEISWDIDMTAGEAEASAESTAGPAVDWDIAAETGPDTGAGAGINWDLAETGLDVSAGTVAARPGSNAHAAAGTATSGHPWIATRLAKDGELRTRLLDDLYELRSFLKQRTAELRAGGHEGLAAVAPEAVQRVGTDVVEDMLAEVEAALAAMTSERVRQLLMVGTSKRYLGRLTQALQRKAGQEDKFKRLAKEAESKHVEVQQSLMTEAPKAAALRKRTADIKLDVERVLSGLFQGRTVNIIGEINNLI